MAAVIGRESEKIHYALELIHSKLRRIEEARHAPRNVYRHALSSKIRETAIQISRTDPTDMIAHHSR